MPSHIDEEFVWEEGGIHDVGTQEWCKHVSITHLYVTAFLSSVAAAVHVRALTC